MIQYRKFVVSMLLHISGSEVTEAARKSEDIENDIAKVANFDKGEHDQGHSGIMTSEQSSNEVDVKQKRSESIVDNSTSTCDGCPLIETEHGSTSKLELKVSEKAFDFEEMHDVNNFIKTQDCMEMSRSNTFEIADHANTDLNNKIDIDIQNKYHHNRRHQNSPFAIDQDSFFRENGSSVFSNKDNTPDILIDTKEKEHLKLNFSANTQAYHSYENNKQPISNPKSNLELPPTTSNKSVDFITISEWNEQEEERYRHQLAHNPSNPNSSDESIEKRTKNGDISENENRATQKNDDQIYKKGAMELHQQNINEKDDVVDEFKEDGRDISSSNTSEQSNSPKGT